MAEMLCTSCGHVGDTKTITKGSILIELILWLMLLVPGLIYSIWRHASRYEGCANCRQTTVIPVTSPVARKFILDHQLTAPTEAAPNGHRGYQLGKNMGRLFR